MVGSSELLDVQPLELRFHREPHNMCSLHLTNKTNEHVAFRVTAKSGESDRPYRCFVELPLSGSVPPGSTCRLIVKTVSEEYPSQEMDLVLQSSIAGDKNLVLLAENDWCNKVFNKASELGHVVHELALKVVYDPAEQETTFEDHIIVLKKCPECICCLDAHPTKPWIMAGGIEGNIYIWNCDSQQELLHTFRVSMTKVMCVKFIPRKGWIVVHSQGSSVHVYDCANLARIKKITGFGDAHSSILIAIHPIKAYVLTSSWLSTELWDGNKGWKSKRTVVDRSSHQAFNPEDPNSFVTVSHSIIEVWTLDSAESKYAMFGHTEDVACLAYFTQSGHHYLITGSFDCTAKIWDLHKKVCIHTLEGFMSPVTHVISLPGHPFLVTCSNGSTIHVWSTTDFRLRTTVNFSGCGDIKDIACLVGSRRIVIAQKYTISIMDIDDEEEVASEGNSEGSLKKVLSLLTGWRPSH